MRQQIEIAFARRKRPSTVTTILVNSSLRDDARHFEGMDWTHVSAEDWHRWSDAFFGFSPAAFVYFLPSLLIVSLESSERWLGPADSLVSSLDTSADPDIWAVWFSERFPMLTLPELEVLSGWLTIYLNGETADAGSKLVRAQDTIMMLRMLAKR